MYTTFTEENYENAIIELFQTELGYEFIHGPDVVRDYHSPFYDDVLFSSLQNINDAPDIAIEGAISKLKSIEDGNLVAKNKVFSDYLQNGITVNYTENNEQVTTIVYLLDYDNVENNSFFIANQWTIIENSEKRPDVIIFVNGLPLVVAELKSPSREEVEVSDAFYQLRNYMLQIPSLFIYNAFCVMSNQAISKAGTITADEERFMEWKSVDGSYDNTLLADFSTFFVGMFDKTRLLDIIKNYICFFNNGSNIVKILAGYHQYFGVNKAIVSTKLATTTDGKGGVFWHTQGSGKSLSMVFYARLLQSALDSPTIVVITDRNDLDNQLYKQFARCKDFLRQTPKQAESRENLKELLDGIKANGIFFTTMQKFELGENPLSERNNIILIADEAHRGQYGLTEKVNKDTGKISVGTARIIRNSLPNATFIGFTGTPISNKDRSTREVFGDYIDIYDMTQAVEDGATRPVFYESRVIKLSLDEKTLNEIDEEYDIMSQEVDEEIIEKSKRELGKMEAVLGAEKTIDSLVTDIMAHYKEHRQYEQTGKAMIVAYSRKVAISIYKKIIELDPDYKEKIAVVMTGGNQDPEEWGKIIGTKQDKVILESKFKDNSSELKIVIVVDMWLTGFDVPSLSTMYVYKPMVEHSLMQAITRVNRVFGDKEGGLVVDYIGIAGALKEAMSNYTARDKDKFENTDIKETAYQKFLEKIEVCDDFFYGYDYSNFSTCSDLDRAKLISGGASYILRIIEEEINLDEKETTKYKFSKQCQLLKQSLSLCSSIVPEDLRYKSAFFIAVRTVVIQINQSNSKLSFKEINDKINKLLKASIKSGGVVNLFELNNESDFSLFDPKFLEEIAKMEHRNLALELLKKLLAEQVKTYKRTNLIKSEQFSVLIQGKVNAYINGMITNEELISEMIQLAKEMANAHELANELGLTDEEMAFYDALTKPQAIIDFYENDQLIAITKELLDTLRKNKVVDWQNKESARANMRKMIKRLLLKYEYPPENRKDATEIVMKQCELWVDNSVM